MPSTEYIEFIVQSMDTDFSVSPNLILRIQYSYYVRIMVRMVVVSSIMRDTYTPPRYPRLVPSTRDQSVLLFYV